MGSSPPDRATSSTASRKRSQPRTSSTEVKRPAIDRDAPSSTVDDERTTSASRPESDKALHSSCSASSRCQDVSPSSLDRVNAVVTAKPGRTGTPATRARASADALAPTRSARRASGASRLTTSGIWSPWAAAVVRRTGWSWPRPRTRCSRVEVAEDRNVLTAHLDLLLSPSAEAAMVLNAPDQRNSSLRRRAFRHTPW